MLKQVKLIIWDEVPMQHRFCVEAVDRTLRDIGNKEKPFSGITVVLGGDFRQTLPVIAGGCREAVVGACLRRSLLWNDVTVLALHQNMRLDALEPDSVSFAKFLLEV
ncbi:hypothetical protein MKW98_015678 [Papaver atlanticum]|uniref:ATP-dependent DNA helicase n=1 Tax=Papaver atlanticum TaxID=357466 RepID=A0AAD4XG71_9MAGN|nr:hypothetical protein MKW98_015678 [Papaver atlanticum]